MELLPKRGPKAWSTLVEILDITNPWLAEKMKSALHEERNREAKLKVTSSLSHAGTYSPQLGIVASYNQYHRIVRRARCLC